jgi:hypothetical protein
VKEEFAEFCASMIRRYAPHTAPAQPGKVLEVL